MARDISNIEIRDRIRLQVPRVVVWSEDKRVLSGRMRKAVMAYVDYEGKPYYTEEEAGNLADELSGYESPVLEVVTSEKKADVGPVVKRKRGPNKKKVVKKEEPIDESEARE